MHLLDVKTFELKDRLHLSGQVKYAILSHRWATKDEDITFGAFMPSNTESDESKQQRHHFKQRLQSPQTTGYGEDTGVAKIAWACHKAREDGIPFIWMDTVCIDKRPGSDIRQISQALTSMYQWYQEAQICYTYLPDVVKSNNQQQLDEAFRKSEWFTRGWTLQELLAPRNLHFFDVNWSSIGTKKTLLTQIQQATNIEARYLDGDLTGACIAVKMSWISKRMTKFKEDMAYCMLGIFGVAMDVQYGRGAKEFLRLQEILVDRFDDESIFAWADSAPSVPDDPQRPAKYGMLAPWPSLFQNSSSLTVENIKSHKGRNDGGHKLEKEGVSFPIPMKFPDHGNGVDWNDLNFKRMKSYKLGLNCWQAGQESKGSIVLQLEKDQNRQWRRANIRHLAFDKKSLKKSFFLFLTQTRSMHIPHQVRGDSDWGAVMADQSDQEIKRRVEAQHQGLVPEQMLSPPLPSSTDVQITQKLQSNPDPQMQAEDWRPALPSRPSRSSVTAQISRDTGTYMPQEDSPEAPKSPVYKIARKPVLPPRPRSTQAPAQGDS
ncbi:MAG: hypothetical protein Q9219_001823 [cf. Caloplaca sp. 3 TL-2023]